MGADYFRVFSLVYYNSVYFWDVWVFFVGEKRYFS